MTDFVLGILILFLFFRDRFKGLFKGLGKKPPKEMSRFTFARILYKESITADEWRAIQKRGEREDGELV